MSDAMFTILLYILLPLCFLVHDFEEYLTRKRWAQAHSAQILALPVKIRFLLAQLKGMSNVRIVLVMMEEFLIICFAVVCAIYGSTNVPLIALTWGFNIHLIVHIMQAAALKSYVPGFVTSIVLIPYAVLTTADMLQTFSWAQNVLYALVGLTVVYLNLLMMFSIVRPKHNS